MPVDSERMAAIQARHRYRNFERLMEYLREHPCADCAETDPVVLDFDHLPGSEKRFDVGRAVSGSTRSWASILREIEKCDVVCANCHRRRTAARAGFRKHRLGAGEPVAEPAYESRPRFTVEHGGGSKGRHNCTCEPCRERRRQYQAAWRANRA